MESDRANSAPPENDPAESHSESPAECPEPAAPTDEAFASLRNRLEELADYFAYYLSSRIDALKLAVKRRIILGVMVAVAVLAGAGAIVMAVVLLCEGICDGLSVILGHRWAGELATGVLLLGALALVAYLMLSRLIRQSRLRTIGKYEAFRARQRDRFGRDVAGQGGDGKGHE
ncbi:MAG: hypothetical protein ABSD28_12770 [Tepidisphaeraceae bacterium]|jgi:hypothetical protein